MGSFNTVIFVVASILLPLFYFWYKAKNYWKNRNFPCNNESAIISGDFSGMGTKEHMAFVLQRLYKKFKEQKHIVGGVRLFWLPTVIIIDPEIVKHVLIKDFNYFHDRGVFNNAENDPLSAHLFSLEGQQWRNLRAKLTPTFTSGKLKMMFGTILEVAEKFGKHVENKSENNTEIEMKDVLSCFTTDVIGSCAFGLDVNSLENPNSDFRVYGNKVFDVPTSRTVWFLLLVLFPKLSDILKLKLTDAGVEKFFLGVVRDTIEYREKNKIQRNDFMNLLIEIKNRDNDETLTFNELAAQCFIFFLAGFETSSTTMMFCLYELALNPDVQEKLRDEINAKIEDNGGEITYETVLSMPYLDQVIQETLRKYPPVTDLMRKASKDYQVPGTELVIPKGTIVFVPVYAIQNDPEYFPEPQKFNPDRFSSENIKGRHPFVNLPFGEGPRICIGMRFGMMQTRIGLITLLRKFRISPSAKTPISIKYNPSNSFLSPIGGMCLNIDRI